MHAFAESWAVQLPILFKVSDTIEDGWITYWLNVHVVSDTFLLNGIHGRHNVTMKTLNSECEICIKDQKGACMYKWVL
jgi:hypothetical protein